MNLRNTYSLAHVNAVRKAIKRNEDQGWARSNFLVIPRGPNVIHLRYCLGAYGARSGGMYVTIMGRQTEQGRSHVTRYVRADKYLDRAVMRCANEAHKDPCN